VADYNTAKLEHYCMVSSTVGLISIPKKLSRFHFISIKDWRLKTDHHLICLTCAGTEYKK